VLKLVLVRKVGREEFLSLVIRPAATFKLFQKLHTKNGRSIILTEETLEEDLEYIV
jgi:hypothetical protein